MLARLDIRDLSDAQQDMLRTGDSGDVAEELVAEELGPNAKHRPNREDWFDVVRETTGAKTEVKSTWSRIGEEYPADGRFRLWRAQLRSLLASDASGTAWVAFVLFDEDSGEVLVRRARPSTVSEWVAERGGWNESGHDEYDEQHKLPHSVVFPEVDSS